jgi:hypothetical protein
VRLGNPSAWVESFRNIHIQLVEIVSVVWPSCADRFNPQSEENKITDQLALMLQRHPDSRKRWLIEPQHKLLDSDSSGDVVTKGFIDFALFFTLDQETYIAYECKRLNVHFPSGFQTLADKYVDEGVMRYVSAQYAQGLPFGVMIGYVLDSDTPKALNAVKRQIKNKTSKLLCPPPINLPEISFIHRFSTIHNRLTRKIEIEHLLLPLQPT